MNKAKKNLIKHGLVSFGILAMGIGTFFGGKHFIERSLPKPTPIVREYEDVNKTLSILKNRVDALRSYCSELPYTNEQIKQDLEPIKCETEKISGIERAIQHIEQDRDNIAKNPELISYNYRTNNMNNYMLYLMGAGILMMSAGIFYITTLPDRMTEAKYEIYG